jgi:hypothetical protein
MLALPPLRLSDHDVVYIEADIWLRKVRQQPRIILRYDKANWENIKSDLEDTLKKIITINNDTKSTVNFFDIGVVSVSLFFLDLMFQPFIFLFIFFVLFHFEV